MWPYPLIPVGVAFAGVVWAVYVRPRPAVIGAIQHFAAGVIFYAGAGDLLPEAVRRGTVWPVVAGGAVGIVAMLALNRLSERAKGPAGLIGAAAIDSLIDGIVLGLAFAAGAKQGLLLAVALAIEYLFLGLSIAGAYDRKTSPRQMIVTVTAVSLAVPLGALLATPLNDLRPVWHEAAFAFGLVALLYLVLEELMTEAHEKPETAWGTAMLFVGFLAMTVLAELLG